MTKLLAIHGALEIDNFGDVLLGRIFCDWARDAGWHISAPSAAPQVASQLGSLVDADYTSADKILYIGGGYFGEPPRTVIGKWRWGRRVMSLHLQPTCSAREKGIPFAVAGVGAGPVTNPFAKRAIGQFLKSAASIAIRDRESADFLKRMGIVDNVEITADAALSLSGARLSDSAQASLETTKAMADGRRILLLHLAKPREQDSSSAKIFDALSQVNMPEDVLVLLVSDQAGTVGAEQQVVANQQVAAIWPTAKCIPYLGVDSLIGTIAAADYVVTTKLHVGIVGTALGRRVLALPAHTKTSRFYRQVGWEDQCLRVEGATAIELAKALTLLLSPTFAMPRALEQQVENALLNRRALLRFLSDGIHKDV